MEDETIKTIFSKPILLATMVVTDHILRINVAKPLVLNHLKQVIEMPHFIPNSPNTLNVKTIVLRSSTVVLKVYI